MIAASRLAVSLGFVLIAATGVLAQQVLEPVPRRSAPATGPGEAERTLDRWTRTSTSANGPPVRDVTGVLNRQPAARRALRGLAELTERTNRPGKQTTPDQHVVGDTTAFHVYDVEEEEWIRDVSFVLEELSPRFYLWVETAEIENGHVRDRDVDSLYRALEETTPPRSYDPGQGIIRNVEELFGTPSDVDGNDRVHVLLTDIKDGRRQEPNEPFIAGFFYGVDLDPDGEGNGGEVIYLDTQPGIYTDEGTHRVTSDVQATAAQEYQHLVHARYDADELTFVNEGQGEWAEVANGYAPRSVRYLASASDSVGYNVRFLGWRSENRRRVLYDYQRAGLWTEYLSEQIGPRAVGRITRYDEHGLAGYTRALRESESRRTLAQMLVDFHTANFLNDPSIRPAFGYESTRRSGMRAVPSFSWDGRVDVQTLPHARRVNPGAVQYLVWEHVRDLELNLSTVEGAESRNFALRAIVWRPGEDGPTVRAPSPGGDPIRFDGSIDRMVVVAAHVRPNRSSARLAFSATWERRGARRTRETVAYDTGSPATDGSGDPHLFSLNAESDGALSTRFAVPGDGGAVLDRVSLVFYYLSQFQDGPPRSAPRDFRLHVWADDGSGRPGRELFTRTYDDPRPYSRGAPPSEFRRFSLDLSPFSEQLDALPDTIHVGVSETGDDENYVVAVVAPFSRFNTSFLWSSPGWQSIWNTVLSDDSSLRETTLPFRAEFLVPARSPDELQAEGNFPNPFRHTTRVRFTLPENQPVEVRVYDALGRHVSTPLDASVRAGPHTVPISAEGWPPGVYVYVIETADRSLTGAMTVLP